MLRGKPKFVVMDFRFKHGTRSEKLRFRVGKKRV